MCEEENKNVWSRCKDFCCNLSDNTSFALSIFYGIFVVNLAIVCIVSQYIASVGPMDISEYYLNILYFISIVWLASFALSVKYGKNRSDAKEPVKSYHASNRWLKGVVAIFGFSIAIKDTLELFALSQISNPYCSHKSLHIMSPILHAPYIFGQVAFLFLFAKHHIQEWRHFARFGIMHIIATNLSVWLTTIATEATEALVYEKKLKDWQSQQDDDALVNESNPKAYDLEGSAEIEDGEVFGFLFRGNCTCKTAYCNRVVKADKFLFPFLIEFCLISTCLLYVTWRKVGKKAMPLRRIFKPCYKLFKAYKGPTMGAFVLASTITVIILLGSFESNEPHHKRNYFDQHHLLHLYETFLSVCELANLAACLVGFYLYAKAMEKKEHIRLLNLDVVLLFVCFIGPLIAGLFSVLSLSFGPNETKAPGWGISLVYPIVDITGTLLQILFIIYGMQFSPTPEASARLSEFVNRSSELVEEHCLQKEENCNDDLEMSHLKEEKSNDTYHDLTQKRNSNGNTSTSSAIASTSKKSSTHQTNKLKIVEKIRIAKPDASRRKLREVLMFLVISNASIWGFLSLDKTLFTTLAYQYDYFGHGVWTTVTAVTTPLSIFLHMHSAAIFFELWSYA